ncbi:transketolase family protein [Patescibacteria group bacterium]|jgi:transketolase|nr:transketolase family protein [Patescibacteria group bacterium]
MAKNLFLNPKVFAADVEQIPTRNGYGDGLVELGKEDERVVVLTGDLAESTRAHLFQKAYPKRFFECGVAEQNMMGVAAGLALSGKIPFVSSYAVFVPGRNWDQFRVSVCYTKANVKVAGAHAGISVGPDGATHQALEDLAITRVLPNLTVVVPCDYQETKKATKALANMKGPAYFRFAREKTPVITTEKTPFKLGEAIVMREGKDVTIAACGPLVHQALVAAEMLKKQKISCEVVNCHTLKPFDEATLVKSVKKTNACVTVEEHQIIGGLAGAVSETLGRNFPAPIENVGMPNSFGESGEPNELLEKYGMTAKHIMKAVQKVLKRK